MPLTSLLGNLKGFRAELITFINSPEILEKITELKRDELSQGKRGDNSDITPKYDDVPRFRGWYLEWKKTLPTYNLNGTPDLYIDGTFYGSLFTIMQKIGVYKTDSDYSLVFMADVIQMHDNGTLLDLTPDNIDLIGDDIESFILNNFNV